MSTSPGSTAAPVTPRSGATATAGPTRSSPAATLTFRRLTSVTSRTARQNCPADRTASSPPTTATSASPRSPITSKARGSRRLAPSTACSTPRFIATRTFPTGSATGPAWPMPTTRSARGQKTRVAGSLPAVTSPSLTARTGARSSRAPTTAQGAPTRPPAPAGRFTRLPVRADSRAASRISVTTRFTSSEERPDGLRSPRTTAAR